MPKFINDFNCEGFFLAEPLISKNISSDESERWKKNGKSEESDYSRINLKIQLTKKKN